MAQSIRWKQILLITGILGIQGIFIICYTIFFIFQKNWCGYILPDGSQKIYFGKELCLELHHQNVPPIN
ncbi:hypothetical protein C7H19_18265 [Aphanothece hegewaldii CCALA 016]|uniref:Uncharacterized protein n=1 Tax=Aphanothece hegewaldii CCALA 016 TaxID=2107694 RepID=A0A2T1LU47_9CHRO|nr:hypothetical protein [Aphanothece hegewaldii]PSF34951.1 hypothetical protein C7H19_18265 [Aphanothece hegewaldii CCALA 016]